VQEENIKFLIIGLGNIGGEYHNTRHNIGFDTVDKIVEILDLKYNDQKKFASAVAVGKSVILAKPNTFMNRSGLATSKLKEYYKTDNEYIVVVSDDYNLELGKVRIRFDGDSGGHNGLESVMEQVGGNFWRVRIGIGNAGRKSAEIFVLEKFSQKERKIIDCVIDKTAHYLADLLFRGELKNESINVGECEK